MEAFLFLKSVSLQYFIKPGYQNEPQSENTIAGISIVEREYTAASPPREYPP